MKPPSTETVVAAVAIVVAILVAGQLPARLARLTSIRKTAHESSQESRVSRRFYLQSKAVP
jgi:hypothetical protein